MLVLGAAAVAGISIVLWYVVIITSDVLAYIDTHGWTRAMERLDQITAPLWRRTDK
jgi:hypothetical protein